MSAIKKYPLKKNETFNDPINRYFLFICFNHFYAYIENTFGP